MVWFSRLKVALSLLALAVLVVLSAAQPVSASLYGEGDYGSCPYQSCPQPPPPTVTTTPTGLEVSINLTDGQKIPLSGYTIIITPLNGQGASFKQAAIYVNGTLSQTALPDETGTARWLWTPQATGHATVKVVITDTTGQTTTQQFNVTVDSPAALSSPVRSPVAPKPTTTATGLATAATRFVKALPVPVVRAFPYVLFLLLGVDAALLLVGVRSELREYKALQAIVTRARALGEAKLSLVELVSHYLRTPLALVEGGIDLLKADGPVPQIAELRHLSQQVRAKIEQLVGQVQPIGDKAALASSRSRYPTTHLWQQWGLYLPILLIGAVWLVFEYLVARAGTFSVGDVDLVAQTIVFVIGATGLYLVVRHRHLRHRDVIQMQQILASETAIGESRDRLITRAVVALSDDLRRLDELAASLPLSWASKAIATGQQRFHDLLAKFHVAEQLKGSHCVEPYRSIALADLLASGLSQLRAEMTERQITVRYSPGETISVQAPELLAFVLSTLLDNAVAYSRQHGSVEVGVTTTAQQTIIALTDHGSGVPAAKQPLLFQPFVKVEGAEVVNHQGMGFSLYLDRLVMTYLGGTISLRSGPGSETTVQLQLPHTS